MTHVEQSEPIRLNSGRKELSLSMGLDAGGMEAWRGGACGYHMERDFL